MRPSCAQTVRLLAIYPQRQASQACRGQEEQSARFQIGSTSFPCSLQSRQKPWTRGSLPSAKTFWAGRKKRQPPETYRGYRFYAQAFREGCGYLQVGQLKPQHVMRWLDQKPWNETTQCKAIHAVDQPQIPVPLAMKVSVRASPTLAPAWGTKAKVLGLKSGAESISSIPGFALRLNGRRNGDFVNSQPFRC